MLMCLQAGRALAAMAVVAFHLSGAFGDPRYGGQPIGDLYTHHGNLGVDFFFVLSGFIILNAHIKDVGHPGRWATYIWRRFARVYPIYWIYLAAFCLLLGAGAGQVAQNPRGAAAWASAVSLVHLSPDAPPLHVAWTLFHEIAFYALFSLLILNRWIGVIAIAAWTVICTVLFHYNGESGFSALSVYTSAYNLEFIFGMGAYALFRRGRHPWALLVVGCAILIGAYVLAEAFHQEEHWLFGIGFALAIAGATIAEARGRFPTPKALVEIGGSSYSLYLIHVPVMGMLLKIVRWLRLEHVVPNVLLWWLVFAATVAIAYAAWVLLEKPLQSAMRFRTRPAPAPA